MKEIVVAAPRGFCAGVDRAISIVERAIEVYGTPLYVHHEIVHNRHVVDSLRAKGVIFVDTLEEIPANQTVIFSAHGVSPAVVDSAKQKNLKILDATCPLVTKVHIEARRYAREGYRIILIGHKDHIEAKGTYGEAPDQITIVETLADIEELDFSPADKLAYLTQTTLSVRDTRGLIERLKERFPQIEGPSSSDICYATTNRQEAVSAIAPKADIVYVIGSRNSSNSNRLKELAESEGARAYLIDSAADLSADQLGGDIRRIGITAGASAPEILVQQVTERLKTEFGFTAISELRLKEEDVTFKLPR
ncbi:MAG: 4-hydroxy-3-methylbut-2-enyl diphosphate reductase, partial [Spirochaetes bacterium]|nr:4-hydroxy-3-methylbut-2-enyl diphosphate reductase [Spirochaetota bacterium]